MREEHIQELMAAPENNEEEDTEQLSTRKTNGKNVRDTYSINMHLTQHLYKVNSILGYKAADEHNCWYLYEHHDHGRDRLIQYLKVCPWNFVPGWSQKEDNGSVATRSTELGIEANLVDPDIYWNTKESQLTRYRHFLVPLLKPGRNDIH